MGEGAAGQGLRGDRAQVVELPGHAEQSAQMGGSGELRRGRRSEGGGVLGDGVPEAAGIDAVQDQQEVSVVAGEFPATVACGRCAVPFVEDAVLREAEPVGVDRAGGRGDDADADAAPGVFPDGLRQFSGNNHVVAAGHLTQPDDRAVRQGADQAQGLGLIDGLDPSQGVPPDEGWGRSQRERGGCGGGTAEYAGFAAGAAASARIVAMFAAAARAVQGEARRSCAR